METATKTIASFEALTPELFAPQGTLETDLGLPASLNAQFSDGVAGEIPVTWQCAAGYDPNAAAGGQFAFAAVLPEGYALSEGVSLPQILVTLTPPLANAMLAAESDEDWTLSDGKLTVTGKVNNSEIPSFGSVESIEIVADASLTLTRNSNFSGDILIADGGSCNIGGTISDGEITVYGYLYLRAEGEITSSANVQISGDTSLLNFGTITGGTITGTVENTNTGSITGGDFTSATVKNIGDATVTGGTFSNVAFDSTSGELTITGNVDLDEEDALAPLTIRQAQIKSVVVSENGTFNAGSASFFGPVTNNGTITGGTITGPVTNSGEITGGTFKGLVGASATEPGVISGGTFEGEVLTSPSYVISGGDFKNVKAINGGGIINGGIFSNFTMDSETGELTITGTVDLSTNPDALDPLTITLDAENIQSITVAANATFNAGSTPVSVDVTNDGAITGGMFTGKITGTGTITAGDFFGADISGFTGVLTGGTFYGFTIHEEEPTGRILTITAQDFDLTGISLAGIAMVVVAEGASVANADVDSTELGLINYGTINNGIFAANALQNFGTITGGTFDCMVSNESGATISGGKFNASHLGNSSTITGAVINGNILYNTGTITGCTFGGNAQVSGDNTGTIEVTMTIDGESKTFRFGDNVLDALNTIKPGADWCAVEGDKRTPVTAEDAFGLQRCSYNYTYYVEDTAQGSILFIIAPVEVTDEMLEGISTVNVTASGEITGGTLNSDGVMNIAVDGVISGGSFSENTSVQNWNGEITGGTFDCFVYNYATISGGAFNGGVENRDDVGNGPVIQGKDGRIPEINSSIVSDASTAKILQPCDFGPNASVTVNNGVIEVKVIVDEVEKTVNYGADILEALGPSPTGLWYRENEDDTRSLVKEGETFASLQTETYTSQVLLPVPEIEIDYRNERIIVTLAEEEVPEGVDVTDIDINFRLPGQSMPLYTDMTSTSIPLSLGEFAWYWNMEFPSDKEIITLEARYSFAVIDANGNETDVAWSEWVDLVIPARPVLFRDNLPTSIDYGYDWVEFTFAEEKPYAVMVHTEDGTSEIYDTDGDLRIEGLAEGTQYHAIGSLAATEDSFASPWYDLEATFTTLTRTRLSVEAAETSWEWQQGFSLNAADCFAVQVTLQGEKEMPEKGKFILTATKDGQEVPFPLTEPGAYTITASLSADVADDYVLDNTSFTVVIGERRHEIDSRDITVRPIPAQTYTGGPIYPAVSVWHGATQLVMGEDYTVSYQNNVKVGVATIVITGMGDYAGTRLAFFDIVTPQATEEEEKPSGGSGSGTSGDNGETTETTGEAQQNRLVVDENGQAMPYTYSTVEVLDEETGAVIARKLVIVADPVRDETGAIVYDADGQPLYEARSLLLSRELLDAIASRGYTHIRFMVKDAALEWPLASMPEDSYIVRLAPMEENEWNEREIAAVEGLPVLSQGYRAQIVTVENGEETDVTKDILELKALMLAEAVSFAPEGMEENLLLVPLEKVVESSLSPANWVEATQIEPARYEALLTDSGLFAMVGEQ